KACDLASGPYAPNTVMTILGSGLAWSTQALTSADIAGGRLPTTLNGTQVFVGGWPAPIFFVSDNQVNFLMPSNQIAGTVKVWVVRQSLAGPQVQLTLVDEAPALFPSPIASGYAIAQHWPDYSVISPALPAGPGGVVILYATGLGKTDFDPALPDEIPLYPGSIERMQDLSVYLDGKPMDPAEVLYAGLAPGWAGLYQIDLVLPDDAGPDPEIRVAIGAQVSAPGLKLAVQ
ncbi:MAG: IPT/TIG domain-containing protein, partial [Candidatus Aminicenantales bacterium]